MDGLREGEGDASIIARDAPAGKPRVLVYCLTPSDADGRPAAISEGVDGAGAALQRRPRLFHATRAGILWA
jgi:hypothetical protein